MPTASLAQIGAPQGAGAVVQTTLDVGQQAGKNLDGAAPSQGKPQGGQPPAPTQGVAPRPPVTSTGRKRIGLALGGGGALALSEIGVLRWMEENHVPVDVVAGTSMGALLGALYATGHTPQQMAELTTDKVFSQVFRISDDFRKQNFRRREDGRFLPGGFNIGLKHGVSLRNGVLLDYGLNQFLNAQFLPYGAAFSFDDLPLPYRCVATDILVGREAVFKQGPLAEAVRASISIPGVFSPLEDGGHIYVDGALTENLPTDLVKGELHADVVLAVSLPLSPPDAGDTGSVLGILQRSFSVASWSNEVRSRGLADVIIEPIAPVGLGAGDYTQSARLADAGYLAAQKAAPQLLKYRISDAEWDVYQARRQGREPLPLRNFAQVNVFAPSSGQAIGIRDTMADLPGKKVEADRVDAKLDEIRSDGRFDTYYFLSKPGQAINLDVTGPASGGRKISGRELLHPEEKRGPGDELLSQAAQQDPNLTASGNSGPGGTEAKAVDSAIDRTNQTAVKAVGLGNTPMGAPVAAGTVGGKAEKTPKVVTIAPASSGKYEQAQANLPGGTLPAPGDVDLNLIVRDRPGGPPYLLLGGNVIAQTGGTSRATIDGVLTQQDLGGYGS
ncbi:MAG: patatin-like phospholipase family protein, partial [Janthinobacterium lividum]